MNRGRGRSYWSPRGHSSPPVGAKPPNRHSPVTVGADGHSNGVLFRDKDGNYYRRRQTSEQKSEGSTSNSKNTEYEPSSRCADQRNWHSPAGKGRHSNIGRIQQQQNSPLVVGNNSKQQEGSFASDSACEKDLRILSSKSGSEDRHADVRNMQAGQTSGEGFGDSVTLHHERLDKGNISCPEEECEVATKSATNDRPTQDDGPLCGQASANMAGDANSEGSNSATIEPFDICPVKTGTPIALKPSLFAKNREKRNEIKRSVEGHNGSVLRSGMVLLKGYLSPADQVKIVKKCRGLGIDTGGFYQPGYRDGAELHLKMMCLGKNWDPEKSEYGERRPHDGAKPPIIPDEFNHLVKDAIQDSHALIGESEKESSVEKILPWMSPNICIVNFYTTSGRLGLHKDRDERQDSLDKGLPVVSFSIGDSAEFLYGDERDVEKAQQVVLKSGDVLIFGGKSRHIFHGVTKIHAKTAPETLLKETNLRPGRLNLTFRQY